MSLQLLEGISWSFKIVSESRSRSAVQGSQAPATIPNISDIPALLSILGFTPQFPWHVIRNAAMCYSTFWIDKDTKKTVSNYSPDLRLREINAPNKALKTLQKKIVDLLAPLPKHPANFAYMRGKSIRMCAAEHENSDVIVKIDIKDFFGSHTSAMIGRKLAELTGWSKEVCWAISRIVTLKGRMPQGSVSSPFLSIVLNYEMDERIQALATSMGFTYTRYADDMAFGARNKNNAECWALIHRLKDELHPYHINWEKVDVMRNSAYRYLCGVIVASSLPDDVAESVFPDADVIRSTPHKTILYRREPLTRIQYENMVSELRDRGFTDVSPKYFYVQDIQRMLGMNITPTIHYPRGKYNDLRLQALLVTKGAPNVNVQRFRGRLSFLRSIDPKKAAAIDKILERGAQSAAQA